jgi:hypothetical protein
MKQKTRFDFVCAFDFRCQHVVCSLVERAFWESVKRVQYARSFSYCYSVPNAIKREDDR